MFGAILKDPEMEFKLVAGPPRRGVFKLVCYSVRALEVRHEFVKVMIPHDLC
jgi:hypothetical protein